MLVWDVTVVDTLAQSYVAATSQVAGAAETRKQRKHEALQNRFIVQPVGFETMETWGARARSFLTDIGGRRVSTEIQHGNAEAVMGTVENSEDWNNLFLLF